MAYTAPNEDTVVVVGGLGTQANKAQLNGGGATKAVWDANSPSDFMETDGGPQATATCAFTTATKNLNGTNIGLNVTVGTLCFVSTGDGAHVTPGVYEITTVTDNDNIICAQIDDDGTNDINHTVNVGGALDTLQNALDNDVNDASSFNRYIYNNIATATVAATIDHDTNGGSSTTRLYTIGYNATLAAESEVIINTTSDITAILLIASAISSTTFQNIDFDGGGKDASRASFCVSDSSPSNFRNAFKDCKFHGAESHGVEMDGDNWFFGGCEAYLNGGVGISTGASDGLINVYVGCSFHDNDSHGLSQNGAGAVIVNNLCYDNGKDGTGHGITILSSGDNATIIGNTCHGNATSGINIDSAGSHCSIVNNTSVENGAYGYELNGEIGVFFGYNHSSQNTTAHTDEVADGDFADFLNGNNQADTTSGANLFVSVADGSEDFTPKTGTDLIDNALDAGTA